MFLMTRSALLDSYIIQASLLELDVKLGLVPEASNKTRSNLIFRPLQQQQLLQPHLVTQNTTSQRSTPAINQHKNGIYRPPTSYTYNSVYQPTSITEMSTSSSSAGEKNKGGRIRKIRSRRRNNNSWTSSCSSTRSCSTSSNC